MTRYCYGFTILAFLIINTYSAHLFKKVLLNDSDALCLDGSKGAYYIIEGKITDKFLISFEGGGWCGSATGLTQTLESCLARSTTALGSSTSYADTISQSTGILSDVADNHFKDWTIARLKYCDGTGHQGYKKDPVSYKGKDLYFRGHNVTIGQLNSMDAIYNFFSASEIAVTGQSAGGLAAFLWTNYIAERASKNTKIWSIPDSGIFLDSANFVTKGHDHRTLFQNFMKLSNEQIDPPTSQCILANPTQKWKCMFAEHIFPFIKVPLFSIQSLYDSWSLHYILGIACQNAGSLANCTSSQLEYIEEYHSNTTEVLKKIGSNKSNGFWAPSCSNHVYSPFAAFNSPSFRVPANSEFSISVCLEEWISGKKVSNEHLDIGSWPINRPCSGLGESLQTEILD